MAASHWLRSDAIDLSGVDVYNMDEDQCWQFLAEVRWGHKDKQVCPDCGALDRHYMRPRRKQWRCKHCDRTFSVTSETPFADRKLSYRNILIVLMRVTISQKGVSALELRRVIGCSYRTSYRLLGKIREALSVTSDRTKLSGQVEIDGAHLSGRIRKGRKKKPKAKPAVPGKWSQQQRSKIPRGAYLFHPNRRIVMAIRQHCGKRGGGAARTVIEICRSENPKDAEALAKKWIKPGSTIMSDEWTAYGNYKYLGYDHRVVNHQIEFSTDDGVNENQAESYFSRLRRMVIGTYHRVTPLYMLDYCVEVAWHEDVRRLRVSEQLRNLVTRVLGAGISRDWRGYGHGNKRRYELLFSTGGTVP